MHNRRIMRSVQNKIVSYVRDGIIEGRFKPGQRLKGREYFCKRFNTTPITVQRAFNRLVKYGFVVAEKSVGSFISEKPTCLNRIALLFAGIPDSSAWTSFSQLVVDSIEDIENSAGVTVKPYFGMGRNIDSEDVFKEFHDDSSAGTLVGAIFLSELRYFRGIAWKNIDLPYYDVAQPGQALGHPRIELAKKEYFETAACTFKELGCSKIAVLTVELFLSEQESFLKKAFEDNALEYNEQYVQAFNIMSSEYNGGPMWIERFLKLLFLLPEADRPDGIFVTDDNFIDVTYKSLGKIGVVPGKDVHVIVHANFPVDLRKYSGMYRLGYHVPNTLSKVCDNLIHGHTDDIVVLPQIRECQKEF